MEFHKIQLNVMNTKQSFSAGSVEHGHTGPKCISGKYSSHRSLQLNPRHSSEAITTQSMSDDSRHRDKVQEGWKGMEEMTRNATRTVSGEFKALVKMG